MKTLIEWLQGRARLANRSPHTPVLLLGAIAGAITFVTAICVVVAVSKLDKLHESESERNTKASAFYLALASCLAMTFGVLLAGFTKSRYLVYAGVGIAMPAFTSVLDLALTSLHLASVSGINNNENIALGNTGGVISLTVPILIIFSLAIIHPPFTPLVNKAVVALTAVASLLFWVGGAIVLHHSIAHYSHRNAELVSTSSAVFGYGLVAWIGTVLSNPMPCDSLSALTAVASALALFHSTSLFAMMSKEKQDSHRNSDFGSGTAVMFVSMLLNIGAATVNAWRVQETGTSARYPRSVLERLRAQPAGNGRLIASLLVLALVVGALVMSLCGLIGAGHADLFDGLLPFSQYEIIHAYVVALLSCWVMVVGLQVSVHIHVNTILCAGVVLCAASFNTLGLYARVFSSACDRLSAEYEEIHTLRDTANILCLGLVAIPVLALGLALPHSINTNTSLPSCLSKDNIGKAVVLVLMSIFFWIGTGVTFDQSASGYNIALCRASVNNGLLIIGTALMMWISTVFSVVMPSGGLVTLSTLLAGMTIGVASPEFASLQNTADELGCNFEFKLAHSVLIFSSILALIPAVEFGRKFAPALSSLTEPLVKDDLLQLQKRETLGKTGWDSAGTVEGGECADKV